jgi:hypothetical protein
MARDPDRTSAASCAPACHFRFSLTSAATSARPHPVARPTELLYCVQASATRVTARKVPPGGTPVLRQRCRLCVIAMARPGSSTPKATTPTHEQSGKSNTIAALPYRLICARTRLSQMRTYRDGLARVDRDAGHVVGATELADFGTPFRPAPINRRQQVYGLDVLADAADGARYSVPRRLRRRRQQAGRGTLAVVTG